MNESACQRCEELEQEVARLRSMLEQSAGSSRYAVLIGITAAMMSGLSLFLGWLGSMQNWADASYAYGYVYYGVFFGATWVAPSLIGSLAKAGPGGTFRSLLTGLMWFAVFCAVLRAESWIEMDSDLSGWLTQLGHLLTVVIVGYAIASCSGLHIGWDLYALPRQKVSMLNLFILTALIGLGVRLLQLEDQDGVALLILCLSPFISCGSATVLLLMWSTIASRGIRWGWLIATFLVAPLSPFLHPEAEAERGFYALFAISVWGTHVVVVGLTIKCLRIALQSRGEPVSPLAGDGAAM